MLVLLPIITLLSTGSDLNKYANGKYVNNRRDLSGSTVCSVISFGESFANIINRERLKSRESTQIIKSFYSKIEEINLNAINDVSFFDKEGPSINERICVYFLANN